MTPTPPTPEVKKTTQKLRCKLSLTDNIEAGQRLADATEQLKSIEEEKSEVMADFKARTTAAEAEISVMSSKIRQGYEYRDVQCEIRFNDPKEGEKTTVRLDTNETVATGPMTDEEKQRDLPLEPASE